MTYTLEIQGFCFQLGITQWWDHFAIQFLLNRTPRYGDRKIQFTYKDFEKAFYRYTKRKIPSRTIYRIFERLEKAGITAVYSRGFGGLYLEIKSLFKNFRQNSQDSPELAKAQKEQNLDPETDTDPYTPEALIKQQQLIEIKRMCSNVGIKYRLKNDWYEILGYGVDKVRDTLKVFQYRNLRGEIRNPCGWLRRALRDDYCVDVSTSAFDNKTFWRRLEDSYRWIKDQCEQTFGYIPFNDPEPVAIKIGGVKEPHQP